MREKNSKVRPERFDLSLSLRQVLGVVAVALLAVGGAFLLGASAGRSAARAVQPETGRETLARLDEPLTQRAAEPSPPLQAHQALTDQQPIDKAMPLQAQPVALPDPAAEAAENLSPPQVTSVGAPAPAAAPAAVPAPAAPAALPAPAQAALAPAVAHPAPHPAAPAHRQLASAVSAKKVTPARGGERAAAAPSAHGRYTIQVASVSHRGDAERLASRLGSRRPRIVAADVPGKGRFYRVQVGAFDSQDLARRQLASLGRSGIQGVVVAAR